MPQFLKYGFSILEFSFKYHGFLLLFLVFLLLLLYMSVDMNPVLAPEYMCAAFFPRGCESFRVEADWNQKIWPSVSSLLERDQNESSRV